VANKQAKTKEVAFVENAAGQARQIKMSGPNKKLLQVCPQCGSTKIVKRMSGVYPPQPYFTCENWHSMELVEKEKPQTTIFSCGCKKEYYKRRGIIKEVYCKKHDKIANQRTVCKCGYIILGKINLDSSRMKVIPSTAKQQLARHISYTHKGTSEMDYAIRKREGF